MFYSPYSAVPNNFYRAAPINSYIRILNASPNAPNLDIYADDNLIVQNLAYKEFSRYLPVPPGNHNIKIYPTGEKTNPVIDTVINITPGFTFNIAIIGLIPNLSLYAIPEPAVAQNFGRACIRFVNLSPNSPPLDLILPDGTKIFSNVKYKDFTVYACLPPGTYTLQVRPAGTNDITLSMENVQLLTNKYYSIYAVGLFGGSPPLQTFITMEEGPYTSV